MKKLSISLIIALIICLFSSTSVLAVDTKVTLSADKTTAKPGDTITVTLSASCEVGLSYVVTTIEYNDSVLTLQSEEVSNNWKNYGNNQLELMIDTNQIIKEGTLYTAIFKVNDNATEGETIISATGIEQTDKDNGEYTQEPERIPITIVKKAAEKQDDGSNGNAGEQNGGTEEPSNVPGDTSISLSKIEITKEPTKTSYIEGENFDKTGMEVTGTYSDGSKKIITDYKVADGENLKLGQKQVLIHYTEGDREIEAIQKITVTSAAKQAQEPESTKTNTATNNLPSTGDGHYVFVEITLITVIGVCSYIGFKKYKEI